MSNIRSRRSHRQEGGFPAVTDVAVPLGLTLVAHWLAGTDDQSTIRRIERRLAKNYDDFVDFLPDLPIDLVGKNKELYGGYDISSDIDSEIDLDNIESDDIESEIDLDNIESDDIESETDLDEIESDDIEDELDDMDGGVGWTQVVGDLSTPALLTLGAHYLAGNRKKSDRDATVQLTDRYNYSEMEGGNFGGVILKTIDDLIIPLGLMTGAHLLQKRQNARDQQGGSISTIIDLSVPLGLTVLAHSMASDDSEGEMVGGSGLPIIGDTALGKWLANTGEIILTPNTLVPLGLIFVLYMAYRRYAEKEPDEAAPISSKPNIRDMANRRDLQRYAMNRGLTSRDINDKTPFPFALAMGPEVFNTYVENDEQ